MNFKIGQRVVCVDDSLPKPISKIEQVMPWIKKGKSYTVTAAWISVCNGKPLILVKGVWCGVDKLGRQMGIRAIRFRAVVKEKRKVPKSKAVLD